MYIPKVEDRDYKPLTRILATRFGKHLDHMIHATQNGFVPGRDIHDTIDMHTAARALVDTMQAPRSITALMLDFRKAYDLIDSAFLRAVLLCYRLSDRFVDAVMALRNRTTAAFLAIKSKSREVSTQCDIRQDVLGAFAIYHVTQLPLSADGRASSSSQCRHSVSERIASRADPEVCRRRDSIGLITRG